MDRYIARHVAGGRDLYGSPRELRGPDPHVYAVVGCAGLAHHPHQFHTEWYMYPEHADQCERCMSMTPSVVVRTVS